MSSHPCSRKVGAISAAVAEADLYIRSGGKALTVSNLD